jgi:hypothetical protein
MLARSERLFLDLYYRESFLLDDGHAHQEARKRGITYDHCAALWHPYKETRMADGSGPWEDAFPPIPPDPSLPCPWESREEIEKRIEQLIHEVLAT